MQKPTITERQIRNRAEAKSFSRGKEYLRARSIHNTVQRGNDIEARCDGSDYQPYRVQATLSDSSIVRASCTCPYDWGGDCKHIVALLLTYLNNPDAFEERATLHEQLEKRSKDDLIALIEDMIEQYPSLQDRVDTPTPTQITIGQPVDNTLFRKQMQQARRNYDGYDDVNPHRVVSSIRKTAKRFAEQKDWENALRIYSAVVEEATPEGDYYLYDDEGGFSILITEVLEEIVAIIERTEVVDNDTLRRIGLDTLFRAEIWDINAGGVSLADMVYDEMFVLTRSKDVPAIREKIEAAKAKKSHDKWNLRSYERVLSKLDEIEQTDPAVSLERLRQSNIPELLVIKLIEIGRYDEALEIIDNSKLYRGDMIDILTHLVAAGLGDEAVKRVEAKLQAEYDGWLADWLIRHYKDTNNKVALLGWQRRRFEESMNVKSYQELKVTAEILSKWDPTRAEVLAKIQEEKRYDALINIYMHEEAWQKAWDTLPDLVNVPSRNHYGLHRIELDLAQKSEEQFPRNAIKVYTKYAYLMIEQRQRSSYAEAANFLAMVHDLYHEVNDVAAWQKLIREIREKYKRLSALQDELNKAGLDR